MSEPVRMPPSPESPRRVKRRELSELAAGLSDAQLMEAQQVFSLFNKDGSGEISHKELNFALAKLGQHPSPDEVNEIISEFDVNGSGTIDFQEFLQIMDTVGWNGTSLTEEQMKSMQVSFYGQASICRWLDDAAASGSGDVTGDDVGPITRLCRKVVLARSFEVVIYMCIFCAAVVSGMQSYKVDSPYEHATWALVVDGVILFVFSGEILVKVLAEDSAHPHHYFWDHWNTFDFCICTLLIATTVMRFGSQVAPFRLIRLLRAVRLLRTVRLFPKLAIVIETSVKASSSVVYIALFGVLFSYMFAIVGVAAFGRNDPFYFGNLARAMLTLFRVLTMDSWSMIMYYNIWGCGQPNWDGNGNSRGYGDYLGDTGMECHHSPSGIFAAIYFIVFMCTVAFLILNLFIGIITTEMRSAQKEAERQRQVHGKLAIAATLRLRTKAATENPIADAFDVENVESHQTRRQRIESFEDKENVESHQTRRQRIESFEDEK